MNFARSLPLDKALHPDTLLAYRMNGEVLAPSHGFPLRLFVPGWYGVASVKWLRRIEAVDRPFRGYFQTVKYTYRRQRASRLETVVGRADAGEIGDHPPGSGLQSCRSAPTACSASPGPARRRSPASRSAPTAAKPGARPNSWACLTRTRGRCGNTCGRRQRPAITPCWRGPFPRAARCSRRQHDPHWGGYLIHHSRPVAVRVEANRPQDTELFLYDMNAFAEANARLPLDVEMEFSAGEGI